MKKIILAVALIITFFAGVSYAEDIEELTMEEELTKIDELTKEELTKEEKLAKEEKLTKSAKQGHPEAQYNLGNMYHYVSSPRDYKKALHWYTKSAKQGQPSAQYNLGLMYRNGNGMPQDYIKAYAWCHLAVEVTGLKSHGICRDSAAAKLTPKSLIEAQSLSNEYDKNLEPF